MGAVAIIAGILMLALVLWDTFETIVLSKTVQRRFTLTVLFYRSLWQVWKFLVRHTKRGLRQWVLVCYAPMSLLLLIGTWVLILVVGFSLLHWGARTLDDRTYAEYLYFSGVTFTTLGYGDFAPHDAAGHFLSVCEGLTGLGFLAVVISYVPVLYNSFSRRETQIMLLDSKAGSDPTAGELLRRHGEGEAMEDLIELLREWERWSAQQLEAYLSYPVLSYYRSQHDDQSWLNALTCILDACSLIELGFVDEKPWVKPLRFQARATFAMARHVIVDLAYIQGVPPSEKRFDRLSPRDWESFHVNLKKAGIALREDPAKLAKMRAMYEPYVVALARDMFFTLPAWIPQDGARDNWQVSAWDSDRHF
jgi:hypothetical protein